MDNVEIILYDSKDGSFISKFDSKIYPQYQKGEILITESAIVNDATLNAALRKDEPIFSTETYRIKEITRGIEDFGNEPFVHSIHVMVDLLKTQSVVTSDSSLSELKYYPKI